MALNACELFPGTLAESMDRETETGGKLTMTVKEAEFLESATAVAVTVAVAVVAPPVGESYSTELLV